MHAHLPTYLRHYPKLPSSSSKGPSSRPRWEQSSWTTFVPDHREAPGGASRLGRPGGPSGRRSTVAPPRGAKRSPEEARRRENSGPTATLQPGRQSSCGSAIARRGRQGLVHRTRSKAHYGSLGGTKVHKYVPASCLARGLVQGIWNALHMITPIPPPFSRFGAAKKHRCQTPTLGPGLISSCDRWLFPHHIWRVPASAAHWHPGRLSHFAHLTALWPQMPRGEIGTLCIVQSCNSPE